MADGVAHFGVCAVKEPTTEGFRAAFQLESCVTSGTTIVDGWSVAGCLREAIGSAAGTVEIARSPRFAADTSALGGTLVGLQAFGGEG